MSIFNPDVPDKGMPNFFKYSDSISQPKADESKGIALKTIGQGIEGGAELADSVVKEVIKTDVYDRVDAERTKFRTALSNADKYGDANGPQTPAGNDPANTIVEGTPGPPVDIMAGRNLSVPNAITRGLGRIATNEAANEQGKVSATQYHENLYTIAKDLRQTYVPYREFIDREISKITGINPANQLIDDYITNINSAMSNAQKENNYWRQKIVDSGFPDNDKVLAQFEKDGNHSRVAAYLAYNNGIKETLALKQAVFQNNQNNRKTSQESGEDLANYITTQAATTRFYNQQKFASGDMSPADMVDKLTSLSANPNAANDVVYQQLSAKFEAQYVADHAQVTRLLTTPQKRPDGTFAPPISDAIGIEKTKELVDKNMTALYGQTRDFIKDKQFGPAYTLQNAAAATQNNAYFRMLNDNSIGARLATAGALNKIAPNMAPLMTGKFLGSGLDTDLGTFVTEQGRQAVAQTGGKYVGADGKTIYSFRQSLEELERVSEVTGKPVPGQAVANLQKVRMAIIDPAATPESVTNAVKYFYDPKVNGGVLNKLMDDYYDPAQRRVVKGRSSAFADLTDDNVTKAIRSKGNGDDWNKYSTWAKGEFASQFGSSVRELNTSITDPAEVGPKFNIKWNAESKQFKLENRDGTPVSGIQASFVNTPWRTIENLNKGLSNMANIAKAEGSNVDAYLFKVLKDNGFTPNKDIDGVPAQVMRALIVGNGAKINEKGPSVSKFAPEDAAQTANQWMKGLDNGPITGRDLQPQQTRGVVRGNLSDERLLDIKTDEIPEGMSAREFIKFLRSGQKLGGGV